ncbi:hypothetical protein VTL71DRAFT_7434 [Oculimacula yallundae]|uniref:Uncharacterized protein n=1 Tax=Oculimacula yallundae TaxID=86028 RepID=A0ABR4BVA9_9HELO
MRPAAAINSRRSFPPTSLLPRALPSLNLGLLLSRISFRALIDVISQHNTSHTVILGKTTFASVFTHATASGKVRDFTPKLLAKEKQELSLPYTQPPIIIKTGHVLPASYITALQFHNIPRLLYLFFPLDIPSRHTPVLCPSSHLLVGKIAKDSRGQIPSLVAIPEILTTTTNIAIATTTTTSGKR